LELPALPLAPFILPALPCVFTVPDPKQIAASLKRSAEHSHRRKANPYRPALSVLTFYINRAGARISQRRGAESAASKGRIAQEIR
jgi:hypothetical protein